MTIRPTNRCGGAARRSRRCWRRRNPTSPGVANRTGSPNWPSDCGSRSWGTSSGLSYEQLSAAPARRSIWKRNLMTGASDISVFDLCGALPRGTTVLEASAGTGKTHAIGALVTRYVAEGVVTLDELLVVTFGRAASQELRERVRGHLVLAERALADPAAARASNDGVLALPADAPDDEVAMRRDRLRGALAGFDAATIVTTHQFCQY